MLDFKKFEQESLDVVVSLFLDVFKKEPWNDQWESPEHARNYLNDLINTPGFNGYLAFRNDLLIGVIFGYIIKWWSGDEFYLKEFFVNSNSQGEGIGTALYDYMIKDLQKKKVLNIILLTEKSAPAFKFYVKKGFEASVDTVFMYQSIK